MAGPDWSNSKMDPGKLQWWLDAVKPFLTMVTVHHYGEGRAPRGGGWREGGALFQGIAMSSLHPCLAHRLLPPPTPPTPPTRRRHLQ
jgi:hypothetical protein